CAWPERGFSLSITRTWASWPIRIRIRKQRSRSAEPPSCCVNRSPTSMRRSDRSSRITISTTRRWKRRGPSSASRNPGPAACTRALSKTSPLCASSGASSRRPDETEAEPSMRISFHPALLLALALFLAGCSRVDVLSDLSEVDAIELIVLLRQNGIEAVKKPARSTQEGRWAISVPSGDASHAFRILTENDQPREEPRG